MFNVVASSDNSDFIAVVSCASLLDLLPLPLPSRGQAGHALEPVELMA